MEKGPQVDILLATYNSNEKYLREQIESLINQTYKDIKIYISDDASTNKTIEILREYEQKDNRIIVFEQKENIGFNKNFEFLLRQSAAEYIMFCDHDDIWYKTKVEKSIEELIKTKVSMVYCNAKQIDKNDKVINENYFKYKNIPIVNGKSKLAISRCIGIGCSQIITKNIKEKMLPFKNSVMAHDWLVAFISNEENGIKCIEEKLLDYRLHGDNVFGGRNLKQNLSRYKEKNGLDYKAFKNYRKQVIQDAYKNGAQMCLDYAQKEENKKFLVKIINYYEKIEKTKVINIHIISYFKFLAGKNLLKKMIKEIVLFHFPIVAFIVYKRYV